MRRTSKVVCAQARSPLGLFHIGVAAGGPLDADSRAWDGYNQRGGLVTAGDIRARDQAGLFFCVFLLEVLKATRLFTFLSPSVISIRWPVETLAKD